MADIGDIICIYTHVQSDYEHSTKDYAGIALSKGDTTIDVVGFPPGGPTRYERLSQYNPDTATTAGVTYWHNLGDPSPDFTPLDYSAQPEWNALARKQEAEVAANTRPDKAEEIASRHLDERKALYRDLDKKYARHQ